MIIRRVELNGRHVDVKVANGAVKSIGVGLPADEDAEIDGLGAALIPGLHDHHIHLLATAAAETSVACGPDSVKSAEELARALRSCQGLGWVRGIGYHESVAGELNRTRLDVLVPDRPVRVQDRSGSLWVINSIGLDLLGPGGPADGKLWRRDDWLRERLAPATAPSLEALGASLARYGVTSVTDATPGSTEALGFAAQSFPQRVVTLGDPSTAALTVGPRKIVLGDHSLPTFADLVAEVAEARDSGRSIAVHSVTNASLFLLLAVLDEIGAEPGDRIEHAAVAPPEAVETLARLQVGVVTQPSFLAQRGDSYLDHVDEDDVADLWRYGTLCARGVPVACSSDAPYGDTDPWLSIRTARDRMTRSGKVIGAADRVSTTTALNGFLADPLEPGFPPRRVITGARADLVLLDASLQTVLSTPDAAHVRLTMINGEVVYEGTPRG